LDVGCFCGLLSIDHQTSDHHSKRSLLRGFGLHSDAVTSIYCVSSSKILTSSRDGLIKLTSIINASKEKELDFNTDHTFYVHISSPIIEMDFSGKHVMSLSDEGKVRYLQFIQNMYSIGLNEMMDSQ